MVESLPAGTSPVYPAIPSIILTAVQVMYTQVAPSLTANDVARMNGWADGTIEPRARGLVQTTITVNPGTMHWVQFTPAADITVSQISMMTGTTAASGLTLARMGVYEVNSNGNSGTLLARTANDTTIFVGNNTLYTRSFDTAEGYPATITLTAGNRYALAHIITGSASGTRIAYVSMNAQILSVTPANNNFLNGQTDLPATPTGLSSLTVGVWGRLS
jgi:hypothetical protein